MKLPLLLLATNLISNYVDAESTTNSPSAISEKYEVTILPSNDLRRLFVTSEFLWELYSSNSVAVIYQKNFQKPTNYMTISIGLETDFSSLLEMNKIPSRVTDGRILRVRRNAITTRPIWWESAVVGNNENQEAFDKCKLERGDVYIVQESIPY